MEVYGGLELLLLYPFQEALGRGEESFVPRISGPSATSFLGVMPVHVHYEHVHRYVV